MLQRLRKNEDFSLALKQGRSWHSSLLAIYIIGNNLADTRLGVCISKKYSPAVVRNRFKRIIKEALRIKATSLAGGWDVIVVVKKAGTVSAPDVIRQTLYQGLLINKILIE